MRPKAIVLALSVLKIGLNWIPVGFYSLCFFFRRPMIINVVVCADPADVDSNNFYDPMIIIGVVLWIFPRSWSGSHQLLNYSIRYPDGCCCVTDPAEVDSQQHECQ